MIALFAACNSKLLLPAQNKLFVKFLCVEEWGSERARAWEWNRERLQQEGCRRAVILSFFFSVLHTHLHMHTNAYKYIKCSTSLPSTLSPSNAPSDSVPARLACLPSPHPPGCFAKTRCSSKSKQRMSWFRHQWYANESLHAWDLMKAICEACRLSSACLIKAIHTLEAPEESESAIDWIWCGILQGRLCVVCQQQLHCSCSTLEGSMSNAQFTPFRTYCGVYFIYWNTLVSCTRDFGLVSKYCSHQCRHAYQ